MIKHSNELRFDDKKFFIIIAGVAGIGKTTLALSAPKPLLIDLDNGVSRVDARYRKDTDIVSTYEELEKDLQGDLSDYESIVVDTGGKLLEFLKPVVIKRDPKNAKRDGSLSLQGYGAVKREFSQFVDKVLALNKHLIMVFHATEVALQDDMTGLRIRIEGGSKDEVWDQADLGGFIEMKGNKRTICFDNNDRFYAKGTHGVHGTYQIPELKEGDKNDFLTQLINHIKADLNNDIIECDKYQKVMNEITPLINEAKNVDDLNKAYELMKNAEHHLTSKNELWFMINNKATELGVKYDKDSNKFSL